MTKPDETTDRAERPLLREVERKSTSRLAARAGRPKSLLFGLGMFGLVGWSVAVPVLVGIAAGAWLDRRWPGQVSWTLTLLLLGAVLGCLNAWHWVERERRRE